MALEAIPSSSSSSNDLFAFLIYESLLCGSNNDSSSTIHPFKFSNTEYQYLHLYDHHHPTMDSIMSDSEPPLLPLPPTSCSLDKPEKSSHNKQENHQHEVVQEESCKQVRKRKRRRPKTANKEEAETQRMTHIVVERNRRRQMNDHLAELRSLMPDSYTQRGDQASIVGGAIEYVKRLEHLLQSFQAQKLLLLEQNELGPCATATAEELLESHHPLSDFFSYPQYTWCLAPNRHNNDNNIKPTKPSVVADIEVTLTETHANIRILTNKYPMKLSNLVAGFQLLNLSILHLSITSFLDSLVLYSISAKVEQECQLTSTDNIADATHHMLTTTIGEEAAPIC